MKILNIVNEENNRSFEIRLIKKGMKYGLNDCLVYEEDEPVIEFHDTTNSFVQFVSRYYVSTILEHNEGGLCLDGGHREIWSVSSQNMKDIIKWIG